MRALFPSILLLIGSAGLFAQSPHGANFKVNCSDCHMTAGWDIPMEFWQKPDITYSKTTGRKWTQDTLRFNHNKTGFALSGQHAQVDCRGCHASLVFSEAKTECQSCHTDIHQRTVGADCARCHSTDNWLVDRIPELHQDNGFPLLGAHAQANCADCHKSETGLRFERIGNACSTCHAGDYAGTQNPDHRAAGFSTNCVDCHDVTRFDWKTEQLNHDFFPLTKGHQISDCAKCHTGGGSYSNVSAECISCHKSDYDGSQNPKHGLAQFSKTCTDCHTTDPDWLPAKYLQHDGLYFPIYSGSHKGVWDKCADCHTNPSSFTEYTCISCHVNPETDGKHNGVGGYVYSNSACLACHPTGSATDGFDHNKTQFPLTGAHLKTACIDCHVSGYAGTPTNCAACHTADYNQSANPNHVNLVIPTACDNCHSTIGWEPATFAIHNNYDPLNGAHAAIANNCALCHNGDYNKTPNTCAGCHMPDYNQTTNPNHVTAQFSTDCKTCHSETAWVPSAFNHNNVFPLKGAHASAACTACHLNGNYSTPPPTNCAGCHQADYNQTQSPNHASAGFPTACDDCHSESAWTPATFNHDGMYFPIYSGKHKGKWDQCSDCHTNPGNFAVFSCTICHTNPQTNNHHQGVPGYSYNSTACLSCHPKGN